MWRYRSSVVGIGLAVFVWLSVAYPGNTEESLFVIEPPPVGYPEISAGTQRFFLLGSGVYSSVSVMDKTTSLYGGSVGGEMEHGLGHRVLLRGSVAGALLFGDRNDFTATSIPIDLSLVVQPVRTRSLQLFGFIGTGGAMTFSSMVVAVPQPVPLTSTIIKDDTSVQTSSATSALRAGGQLSVYAGDWVASLFGTYRSTGGSYETTQTSTMSYNYPDASGSIRQSGAVSFGFDLLNTDYGIALSTVLQLREDTRTVVVTCRYLVNSRDI